MVSKAERITGSVYGTALGDAWGKDPEFQNHETIIQQHPEFPASPFITDDTQMSLYNMKAVQQHWEKVLELDKNINTENINFLRMEIARSFVEWLHDPDNNRAPGNACLKGALAFEKADKSGNAKTGLEGTLPDSKGCGANMRVMWFGLLPLQQPAIEILSILQSEVTHSHPLALSSAVITALATKAIVTGEVIPSAEGALIRWAADKTEELIAENNYNINYRVGLLMLLTILKKAVTDFDAFAASSPDTNICSFFGEGWVAEEALTNALAAADLYSGEGEAPEGLRRLVYSSGDSDSIAAIGGAFLGAHHGEKVFDAKWFHSFEPRYSRELGNAIKFMKEINGY